MLDLLIAVVTEDGLELLVLRGIDALLVPVDGLELLHQRGDRAVQVAGLGGQIIESFVKGLVGHDSAPYGACFSA